MIQSRRVFVRGLRLNAAIGVYDHERGRTQPLVIDAVLDMTLHGIHTLRDTVNYEQVGAIARDFISQGHITLVETLAEDMARVLLDLPYVTRVEISISKPEALRDADHAGVCVVFAKPGAET